MYHFDFFYTDRHMNNKETNRNYFDVRCGNSQGMQKMTKKWEESNFLKASSFALYRF